MENKAKESQKNERDPLFSIEKTEFEKLKKRTLRSKVKKAIDEIPCECNKLEKYQMKIKDLEERYKSLENQKYLVLLENEKEFKKKNFYHSKPNHNQYFPNLKEIKKAETQTNFHLKHRTNMVQEICKHLNKNEMLEIGEDPGYFIVMEKQCCHKWRLKTLIKKLKMENKIKYNQKEECCQLPMEKHIKFEELLDSKRWDYESGFSITAEEKRKKIERRNNFIESLVKKDKALLAYKPEQNSLDMSKGDYHLKEEEDIKSIEFRNNLIKMKQNDLIKKNEQRRMNFLENYQKQRETDIRNVMRFTTDLSKKNEKGENRINELKNKIDQNKLMAKQKGLENRDMIEKFYIEKRENDEILQLNTDLRKICVERQIKENIEKTKYDKKAKVKHLSEVQERIKKQRSIENSAAKENLI